MEKGRPVELEIQRVVIRPFDHVVTLFSGHPETWLPGRARRHRGPVFTRKLPGPRRGRVVQLSLGDAWSHDGAAHRSLRLRRSGAAPLSGALSIRPGDSPGACIVEVVLRSDAQPWPWQRWLTALAYEGVLTSLADGLAARFAGPLDEGLAGGVDRSAAVPPSGQATAPGQATSTALDRLPPRDLTQHALDQGNGVSHG